MIASLISTVLAISVTVAALHGFTLPPFLPYAWHKTLHVAGVALFVGNMIVGPVWFVLATRTGSAEVVAFAIRLLRLTDVIFTSGGLWLLLLNGLCLLPAWGSLAALPVVYVQHRLVGSLLEGAPVRLWFLLWNLLGSMVVVPPMVVFYQMIAKVPLW